MSEWRTCSQCSANLMKMMKVVFGYFIKLLLKGPHPRVTMNIFKVAIPLVMKPGIEDIPVPGSFVERTGEFHRAGLVVKLFGPCILIITFNPWGGLSDRTVDSFEVKSIKFSQIYQVLPDE